MTAYVILTGYSECFTESGTLATDIFIGITMDEEIAKRRIKELAEEERKTRPDMEYAEVPAGGPVIPKDAILLQNYAESSWYYYNEYDIKE